MDLEAIRFKMTLDSFEVVKPIAKPLLRQTELVHKDLSQNIKSGYAVGQHDG